MKISEVITFCLQYQTVNTRGNTIKTKRLFLKNLRRHARRYIDSNQILRMVPVVRGVIIRYIFFFTVYVWSSASNE